MAVEEAVQTPVSMIETQLDNAIKNGESYKIDDLTKSLKATAGDEASSQILGQKLHKVLFESRDYSVTFNHGLHPNVALDMVEKLIKGGADVNATDRQRPSYKTTPVQAALFTFGTEEVPLRAKLVSKFVGAGANLGTPDADGNNELHRLQRVEEVNLDKFPNRHKDGAEAADILVKAGVSPIAYNNNDQTPADIAPYGDKGKVVIEAERVARGAELTKPEMKKNLFLAINDGDLEAVKTHAEALRASYGDKGMDKTLGDAMVMAINPRYTHHIDVDKKYHTLETTKPIIDYLHETGAERGRSDYVRAAIQRGPGADTQATVEHLLSKEMSTEGSLHTLAHSSSGKYYWVEHPEQQVKLAKTLLAAGADATEERTNGIMDPATPARHFENFRRYAKTTTSEIIPGLTGSDEMLAVLQQAEQDQNRAKALAKEAAVTVPQAETATAPAPQEKTAVAATAAEPQTAAKTETAAAPASEETASPAIPRPRMSHILAGFKPAPVLTPEQQTAILASLADKPSEPLPPKPENRGRA